MTGSVSAHVFDYSAEKSVTSGSRAVSLLLLHMDLERAHLTVPTNLSCSFSKGDCQFLVHIAANIPLRAAKIVCVLNAVLL